MNQEEENHAQAVLQYIIKEEGAQKSTELNWQFERPYARIIVDRIVIAYLKTLLPFTFHKH